MSKPIFKSPALTGLLWPGEPVHLAAKGTTEAICAYEPPPEAPPPLHLSAAHQQYLCEYCWFIATSTGGSSNE